MTTLKVPCCPEITVALSLAKIFFKIDQRTKIFYGKVSNDSLVMSKTHQEPFRPISATPADFLFSYLSKKVVFCGILFVKIPIVQMISEYLTTPGKSIVAFVAENGVQIYPGSGKNPWVFSNFTFTFDQETKKLGCRFFLMP